MKQTSEITIPEANTKYFEIIIDKLWLMDQYKSYIDILWQHMEQALRRGYEITVSDHPENPHQVIYKLKKPSSQ